MLQVASELVYEKGIRATGVDHVAAESGVAPTIPLPLVRLQGRPGTLADHLMLILDGMHATDQSLGPDGPAKQARRPAESLLAAAAPSPDAT